MRDRITWVLLEVHTENPFGRFDSDWKFRASSGYTLKQRLDLPSMVSMIWIVIALKAYAING